MGARDELGSPASRIRAEIAASGPIGFDRFMALALYSPGGFYEDPPVGPGGDFVTSPHVHPVFGELLARGMRELWEHLGRPDPFRLLEIGAGDGTLARQLLDHLRGLPVMFGAMEVSPGARERLRAVAGLEVLADLPDDPHVVLGHELLDNLPFRLVAGTSEILVGVEAGRLVRVERPMPAELAEATGPDVGPLERAVPTGALELIDRLGETLRRGYAVFVDYGGDGGGEPVHGYRGQRLVEDVLADPGTADITAGVDFRLLAEAASARGLRPFPTVSQFRALSALGFADRMREELAAQGALLNRGDGIEAVRRWAGRSRASILVDPWRLGRLRWFAISSPGLPRPSFLAPEDDA
jgi:NADH dehydrogenase [ubiquinone] 1 alpha subcomplex assembly factor 7